MERIHASHARSFRLPCVSAVALLAANLCYPVATQHILRCQMIAQCTFVQMWAVNIKLTLKRPWLLCDVCVAELSRVLDTQAHARTCHGMFDTCHQHVVLLALCEAPKASAVICRPALHQADSFSVTIECIHEATSCQSLKDNRKHNHTKVILKLGLLGRGWQHSIASS